MRKICVITGTRAEYGLLRLLMHGIEEDSNLRLQVIATGMHLSPEFGHTYKAIEQDGFHIDRKVEMLMSSDSEVGIAKSMGVGMVGFADAFAELKPDLIVVLGDRFEIFSAVSVALVARIPVAHVHGGESTEGLIDEAIRHSITKMSHLHFVAAEIYRRRVIQLGEQPNRVFMVGGLGVDSINKMKLLERGELEDLIGFRFGEKNLLITFHPVTLEQNTAKNQMENLLAALSDLKDVKLIFTLPNADAEGRSLIQMVKNFVARNPQAVAYESLGQLLYLSCMAQVDGVVGNSSSGLLEAPTLHKGSINIGDRQRGRLSASSVINCEPNLQSITLALSRLYSPEFQEGLSTVENPYGNGSASKSILGVIKSFPLELILKKRFFDNPNS
jgi:GDP/UDP-N,N'-diacetylbacillosamine 2-epimerase (hydrolysing)